MHITANLLMLSRVFSLAAIFLSSTALASVIAILPPAFPTGSALIDFAGLATGTEVNGLAVSGVSFAYTVAGTPVNGAVIIDDGPGVTNNINPPNIVSIGDDTGTLTITLPSPESLFGYGYAILSTGTVVNATTISLFSGLTPVGSLSYTGVPDPTFTGGFAGIQSTIPFNRVAVTFNSTAAPAFALDNLRFANIPIPEPSTAWLISGGAMLGALWGWRKSVAHRQNTTLPGPGEH
jgi:PEP-CTERM motif